LVALVALSLHVVAEPLQFSLRDIKLRSRTAARILWIAVLALTVVSLPASVIARPDTLDNYRAYPILLAVPVVVLLALSGIWYFSRNSDDRKAFACSCAYLTVMLVGAAIALYPRLLPSSSDASRDITIQKALFVPHTLHVGLIWWAFGMCLALMYFVIMYRMFKGKVSLDTGGYGH